MSKIEFYDPSDTIAAIATPPGEGGVAIIRISGTSAIEIASQLFSGPVSKYDSHTAHLGSVIDEQGSLVDEALLLLMRGKRSFTGEDTVEIQCHGGAVVSRRILELALGAGARVALPGEFTYRAFMNGRIDLAQAEAIQQLVHAKNEWAVAAAADHLKGRLSHCLQSLQTDLIEVAAIFEAWVDFPEEGLEFASPEAIEARLVAAIAKMDQLVGSFHDGRIVAEGLKLCLVGRPNVGKSSLMNALLERDRAIVTSIPGTTRDLLEESVRINGLNLLLVDTAGMRETEEVIEAEGIRRSRQAMEEADLVLLVLDSSIQLSDEEREMVASLSEDRALAIWNKADLGEEGRTELPIPSVALSALTGEGLDGLRSEIGRLVWKAGEPGRDQLMITNLRHKEALVHASQSCQVVLQGIRQGVSPEFLCLDLRSTLGSIGAVLGTDVTEEVLGAIFARFCIGK
jgi:tRNA modification GTPase